MSMLTSAGSSRAACSSRVLVLLAAVLTGLLAVLGTGVGTSARAAGVGSVPVPDEDPFYAQPADIGDYAPGAILDSRRVTALAYLLPVPARTWQIKYRSSDNNGKPTANVTTLLVPNTPWAGPGARPLVSYQTAEDSAGTQCAPSYGLRAGLPSGMAGAESGLIVTPLARNWAVVVPDYQGPDSHLLGNDAEAKGVLDSLRAVRAFSEAGLANSPIGITGYSGGSAATAYAARLQRSYAPELPIKGIALGGVPGDLSVTISQFDKVGLKGAVIMGIGALGRAYPAANLPGYLNARGLEVLKELERACATDAVIKYYMLNPAITLDALTVEPNVLRSPAIVSFLKSISPTNYGGAPMAPVYQYQAIVDELAPIGPARAFFRTLCDAGVPVKKVENPIGEHTTEAILGYAGAVNYLADRFAGKPAPSTC